MKSVRLCLATAGMPWRVVGSVSMALTLLTACAPGGGGGGSGGATSGSGGSGGGATGTGGDQGGSASGGASSSGGATGSGGAVSSGGATGSGGASSGGSSGTGTGGTGTGGATATGGASGTGGDAGGTGGNGTGTGGASGSGTGGAGGSAGPGPLVCPTGATFCSGFEDGTLPTGAVYKVNAAPGDWTRDFALDATRAHVGRSSLRVKSSTESGTSGSAYKMLAVPAPSTSFWVKFYMWSDVDLGATEHNPFAEASESDDPNASANLEFADDAGIAFNFHDDVRWPDGYTRDNHFTLPKQTWHCIEVHYDSGSARNQQLYINGTKRIDIMGWPTTAQLTATFKIFKFGFNELHGPPRTTWYDDVVVAPDRIPCN